MKMLLPFTLIHVLFGTACTEHVHDENCQSHDGYHVHTALMGGELIPIDEHGSGYNLEVIIDESDRLSIYILDAHAEGFVRISQATLEVSIKENNQSTVLTLDAVFCNRRNCGRYFPFSIFRCHPGYHAFRRIYKVFDYRFPRIQSDKNFIP